MSTVLPVMSTGCLIPKLPLKLQGRDLFQRMPNGLSCFLHLKTLLLQSLSSLTFHGHTNTTQAHPAQRPLGSNRKCISPHTGTGFCLDRALLRGEKSKKVRKQLSAP